MLVVGHAELWPERVVHGARYWLRARVSEGLKIATHLIESIPPNRTLMRRKSALLLESTLLLLWGAEHGEKWEIDEIADFQFFDK